MLGFVIDLGIILLFFIALMASICHWRGITVKPSNKRFNRMYYLGIGIVVVVVLGVHYIVGMPGAHLYEFLIGNLN